MKEDQAFLFVVEVIITLSGPKETVSSHKEKLHHTICKEMDGTGNYYLK